MSKKSTPRTRPPEASMPIAVVGVSAIFPGSTESGGFWKDILAGTDLVTDVPASHWLIEDFYDPDPKAPDKTYARRGAFLPDVPFDPLAFGIPPTIVPATDTSQLLALIVAQRVLEDAAGGDFSDLDKSRISVILGVTSAQELLANMVGRLQRPVWVKALRESGMPEDEVQRICDRMGEHYQPWQESTFPGLLGNVVAGRIANRLDLGGTNCVTDAACASTLAAVSMAASELRLGSSDLVITGGVDTLNDIFMFMCFSKTPALSPTGDCRPFSDQADGTLLGEGLGMVALKRLGDAERDGDRIYAVLRGIGSSSDGRAKSVYAPRPEGQAKAIERAYEEAGYGPETVELVEAHGTGTKAGDAAEFEGLKMSFGEASKDRQWCALGSVKSQIGHTKSAAGAAGLFKIVMSLHHKVLPPTIKIERPNPKLNLETSPFYLNTEARPWVHGGTHPRRGSVSSFGFGGSNFHIAVEEYCPPENQSAGQRAARLRTFPSELVLLSADSAEGLGTRCRELAEVDIQGFLIWLAADCQSSFRADADHRLALVASDEADLKEKLKQAAERIEADPGKTFAAPTGMYYRSGEAAGKVAFLFPGQGSQYIGMGADLAMSFDTAAAAWDRTADHDFDPDVKLHHRVFPLPVFDDKTRAEQAKALTATEWAQPAIGAASLSQLALLRTLGLEPTCVGGHSYGEITALHAAGVFDADAMLKVARRRGELMRDAASSTPGAMCAVATTIETLQPLLDAWQQEPWGKDLVLANHNSPKQVVLSGTVDAISEAEQRLAAERIKAKRLPVGTAFHSPLVSSSSAPFQEFLDEIKMTTPGMDSYSNAKAAPYPSTPTAIRRRLAEQIASPVRFVEQVEAMYEAGARIFLEVGPGAVLTGLVGKCLGKRSFLAVSLDRKGRHGITSLWHALGQLATAGQALNFSALWQEFQPTVDPRTLPKPKMVLNINGSNYDKPYPPPGGAADLPAPNPPRSVTPPQASPPAFEKAALEKAAPAARTPPVSPPAPQVASPAPVQAAPAQAGPAQAAPVQAGPVQAGPVQAAPQPVAASGNPTHQAWLGVYQEAQRQTVEAHTAFQQNMATSQTAFLQTIEASFAGLRQLLGGPTVQPGAAVVVPVPQPVALSAQQPSPQQPAKTAPVTAVPVTAPAPVPAAGPDLASLRQLMITVVAEKTGYPEEMLQLDMDMEADLGIDSIKRVEILAAMRERAPELPEVDTGQMAVLRTLQQIVDYMGQGAAEVAPTPAAPTPATPAPETTAAAPSIPDGATGTGPDMDSLHQLMLDVVAEKTGYPTDMLQLDMDMEADLGIDSIKRVEILAAMRERAPELPEVDTGQMAVLRTLQQIVDYMGQGAAEVAPTPATPAPETTAAALSIHDGATGTGPDMDSLHQLMLDVVAEKTGYPTDMLQLDMDMEADLGIDSIKRVEILAAMRERAPELPEVDTGQMAVLRTLQQIVDYMGQEKTDGEAAPSAPQASAVESAVPQAKRYALRTVVTPPAGLALPGLATAKRLLLTDDGGGVAAALVTELATWGLQAEVVQEDGISAAGDTDGLIFLDGLRPEVDLDAALAIGRSAFSAAHTVAQHFTEHGGVFVTVQDTGGDFGLSGQSGPRAALGALAGLVKTAAQEWPRAGVKAIDLERGGRTAKELAAALARELLHGGPELEVGLRADGKRQTLESYPAPLQESLGTATPAVQGGVVVATGGARGVTAATLIALARDAAGRGAPPRLVLLGRTALAEEPAGCADAISEADLKRALLDVARQAGEMPKPKELGAQASRILAAREVRGTVAALAEVGAEARYLPVDVRNREDLATALDSVRQDWGPITGLVHGAGVIEDRFIADKTLEQVDRVIGTKVDGLRHLLAATSEDPLTLICLFSSVTARCGNRGQADYAMANEILNKIAAAEAHRRGGACRVKSLGWGPWKGGMVTPALEARFAAQGVPLIALEEGARMLVEEVQGPDATSVELVLGGEPRPTPLLDDGEEDTRRFDVFVSKRSHAYLEGHAIEGSVVFPVVLGLEWLGRIAKAHRPDLELRSLSKLAVLRGIQLADFTGKGEAFQLESTLKSNGSGCVLALELRDREGRPRYRATAEMAPSIAAPPTPQAPLTGLRPWPELTVYGDVLFHGPSFQVIQQLGGISAEGMAATLQGTLHKKWEKSGEESQWLTDPAALDGGLQLAVLWFKNQLGGASLPLSIGTYTSYRSGLLEGPIDAVLHSETRDKNRAVATIVFSQGGTVVAELEGVEIIRRPAASQAARDPKSDALTQGSRPGLN